MSPAWGSLIRIRRHLRGDRQDGGAGGGLSAERLVHYKLHAEIDERHAEEFFAVIERAWDDERRRYYIEQGLELGAYIFDRLYRDLYAAGREEPALPGSAT